MEFKDLKSYFEQRGYETFIDGSIPYRRIRISKNHYGGEYYEDDWVKWSEEEQMEELEEMTTAVERALNNTLNKNVE